MSNPLDSLRRNSTWNASYQVCVPLSTRNEPPNTSGFTRKKLAGNPAKVLLGRNRLLLADPDKVAAKASALGANGFRFEVNVLFAKRLLAYSAVGDVAQVA